LSGEFLAVELCGSAKNIKFLQPDLNLYSNDVIIKNSKWFL